MLCACAVASRAGAALAASRVRAEDFTDDRARAVFVAACGLGDLRGDVERDLAPMTLDAWREWLADQLVAPAFAELGETAARCEAVALAIGAPVDVVAGLVASRPVMWDRSGDVAATVVAASVGRASAAMVAERVSGRIAATEAEIAAGRAEIVRLATALEAGDRARLVTV